MCTSPMTKAEAMTLGDGANTLTATAGVSFAPGAEICLQFDGGICRLFDSQGENLEF